MKQYESKHANKPTRQQQQKMSSIFIKEEKRHSDKNISRLIFHQENRNLTLKKSYSFDK